MLNKRIKSVLVAGLLILGMGFAKVDSYAAEVNINNTEIEFALPNMPDDQKPYSYNQNGIKVMVFNEEGTPISVYNGPAPKGAYSVSVNWDKDTVKVNSINVLYDNDKKSESISIGENTGAASLRFVTSQPDYIIESINIDYDAVVSYTKNEQAVIDKYKENMIALGTVEDNVRSISKKDSIEKSTWDNFVQKFNDENNGMIIKESAGKYYVYVNIDGEEKLIETIEIEFFDAGNKGWIPDITPGTGQALAAGGIAIGAAAAVGLLVNNRKRKDEE